MEAQRAERWPVLACSPMHSLHHPRPSLQDGPRSRTARAGGLTVHRRWQRSPLHVPSSITICISAVLITISINRTRIPGAGRHLIHRTRPWSSTHFPKAYIARYPLAWRHSRAADKRENTSRQPAHRPINVKTLIANTLLAASLHDAVLLALPDLWVDHTLHEGHYQRPHRSGFGLCMGAHRQLCTSMMEYAILEREFALEYRMCVRAWAVAVSARSLFSSAI